MNVGYPDTKNKQGGHSPLMKKKRGGLVKRIARGVGKAAGKAQKAVQSVKEAYQQGKSSVK